MTWRIPVEWKWPFKLALISHKMPRLSKMSISVYAQTQEPCLNSNMKKADISFPFRRWIQIPDVQHESSALHLLASMKIKTVEKSKQLIRAAVWRLDLTGWWRRGQLHLVITYLFSLISSAFISYVWKQRNVKGWYGEKTLGHSCPEKCYILTKYLTKSCSWWAWQQRRIFHPYQLTLEKAELTSSCPASSKVFGQNCPPGNLHIFYGSR